LESEAYLGQIKWLLLEEFFFYGHTPSLITNRSTKISTIFSTKNHNSLISEYKKPKNSNTHQKHIYPSPQKPQKRLAGDNHQGFFFFFFLGSQNGYHP
jgi:hypothetical protein